MRARGITIFCFVGVTLVSVFVAYQAYHKMKTHRTAVSSLNTVHHAILDYIKITGDFPPPVIKDLDKLSEREKFFIAKFPPDQKSRTGWKLQVYSILTAAINDEYASEYFGGTSFTVEANFPPNATGKSRLPQNSNTILLIQVKRESTIHSLVTSSAFVKTLDKETIEGVLLPKGVFYVGLEDGRIYCLHSTISKERLLSLFSWDPDGAIDRQMILDEESAVKITNI